MKKSLFSPLCAALMALALLQAAGQAQSLWRDDVSRAMVSDKRAANVGDILTIVVAETTTATKDNSTKTAKQSSWAASVSSFLFPGFAQYKGTSPAIDYSSNLKHEGSGAINNSESIVARVAVRVIDVLPNHNLVIEGKRETSFSKEKQTVVLHGVVRAEDVSYDNTVMSYNVADATIKIDGKGTVSDSQNKGWFTRIWDKLNPF